MSSSRKAAFRKQAVGPKQPTFLQIPDLMSDVVPNVIKEPAAGQACAIEERLLPLPTYAKGTCSPKVAASDGGGGADANDVKFDGEVRIDEKGLPWLVCTAPVASIGRRRRLSRAVSGGCDDWVTSRDDASGLNFVTSAAGLGPRIPMAKLLAARPESQSSSALESMEPVYPKIDWCLVPPEEDGHNAAGAVGALDVVNVASEREHGDGAATPPYSPVSPAAEEEPDPLGASQAVVLPRLKNVVGWTVQCGRLGGAE